MARVKLQVDRVVKRYDDVTAVDDISFTVEKGQFKSLLGPSGCGKTTTLRCIAGLEEIDSGQILIDDEVVSAPADNIQVPPRDRTIGMVFQSFAIWPHMTAKQNVMFPLEYKKQGMTKGEREAKVLETLETVGLSKYANHLAANLSGGQKQRVALSRALVVEPEILLMDEPLSSLDAKLKRRMRKEIQSICDEFDIAALYVTHSQDEAMFLSDEIVLMEGGQIIESGGPKALYDNPKSRFGMEFMGNSNTFPAAVVSAKGGEIVVQCDIGRFKIQSAEGEQGVTTDDQLSLCVRPKYCELLETDATAGNSDDGFKGTVLSEGPTQDFTEYEIRIGETEVIVRSPEIKSVEVGEVVTVRLPLNMVKVYDNDGALLLVESIERLSEKALTD